MKKYLRYADGIVLLASAVALLLRLWLLQVGPDEKGLYPSWHVSSVLLLIVSLAITVFLFLLCRHTGTRRDYADNFPASIPAAAGMVLAALGIVSHAVFQLGQEAWMMLLTGVVGLGAAATLTWGGYCRYKGKKSPFPASLLPCLYFALRLFSLGGELGAEPEMNRYLLRTLACILMIPASYQLWGFEVGDGNRNKCLLWTLMAGYFSIAAIAGSQEWPLYLGVGAWMVLGGPMLKYLPRRPKAKEDSAQQEDAVVAEPVAGEAETAAEDFDPDKYLADLLREIDEKQEKPQEE